MGNFYTLVSRCKTGIHPIDCAKYLLKNSGGSIFNFIHVIFKGDRSNLLNDLGSFTGEAQELLPSGKGESSAGRDTGSRKGNSEISSIQPEITGRNGYFDNSDQSLSELFRKKPVRNIAITNLNQAYESVDAQQLADDVNLLLQQAKMLQDCGSPVNQGFS